MSTENAARYLRTLTFKFSTLFRPPSSTSFTSKFPVISVEVFFWYFVWSFSSFDSFFSCKWLDLATATLSSLSKQHCEKHRNFTWFPGVEITVFFPVQFTFQWNYFCHCLTFLRLCYAFLVLYLVTYLLICWWCSVIVSSVLLLSISNMI